MESIFGSHFKRFAVFGIEIAEQVESRYFGKGVDKGSAEARDDVEVAAACLQEWEEAGSINTLTRGKNLTDMVIAVNDEV